MKATPELLLKSAYSLKNLIKRRLRIPLRIQRFNFEVTRACDGRYIYCNIWKTRSFTKSLVSTSDLLEILSDAPWLPNPVDTKRFKPLKEQNGNKVLYFPHWYEDITEKLKKLFKKLSYNLTSSEFMSVPYQKMHLFLNKLIFCRENFNKKL